MVTVALADHRIGIASQAVEQVVRTVAVEPLPDAPEAVEGIIDLRGQVVAVMDLRARLGLPTRPPRTSDHLVVVDTGQRRLALRVDRAVAFHVEAQEAIEPIGSTNGTTVKGAVRNASGLLIILDVEQFLSTDAADALDAAMSRAL